MRLLRTILPIVLAALFIGGVIHSQAQGQTVNGAGLRINTQSGTSYTFRCSPSAPDAGKLVTFNNSSPVAVTLPQAGTSCFVAGWYVYAANLGAGTVTITPQGGSTIGNATLALATATAYMIISDGTNFQVVR